MNAKHSQTPINQKEAWLHFIIWSAFLGAFFIKPTSATSAKVISAIFLMLGFYINIFLLIPFLFKRKKWILYCISLLSVITIANALRSLCILLYFEIKDVSFVFKEEFFKWMFMEYRSFDRFIFSPNSWMIYLTFAYVLSKEWLTNETIKRILKEEKNAIELAFLKSQINPHFLFNTLNNLYALALEEGAQRTSEAVTKLGALMRYNLHDSQMEWIPLSKEIDYLEKYVELQKLRIVNHGVTNLAIKFNLNDLRNQMIAPIVLLPLIENAFKHGVSTVYESLIHIHLDLEGNKLKLEIKNSKNKTNREDEGGFGLKNLQSRLQVLYPGRHTLNTIIDERYYYVNLQLNLRND